MKQNDALVQDIFEQLTIIISETNGIVLDDTIELLLSEERAELPKAVRTAAEEFNQLLVDFHLDTVSAEQLLQHPFSQALYTFFKQFPLRYREEHIHLTGSLTADFIYPRLQALLDGPNGAEIAARIDTVYGPGASNIKSIDDVQQLIAIKPGDRFERYLEILFLPKLILTDKQAHRDAAYHLANDLYTNYNIGMLRLKFSLSRSTSSGDAEVIPGIEELSQDDVVLGLYQGFADFQAKHADFQFILSPSFRKEATYFDSDRFASKKDDIEYQVNSLLDLLDRHPELQQCVTAIDTVGDEKDFYRKGHYRDMETGFRKLQYKGFQIRSHHGETWSTLRRGIQAVDNAMNIWHIDTLEHGLALGMNPNYYFHRLYQRVLRHNHAGTPLDPNSAEYREVNEMDWHKRTDVRDKLITGTSLTPDEEIIFTKVKFHTAREVEHYQHDILNRMLSKQVSLVSLPSSNVKLTHFLDEFKDHPFSWWEKKGVQLGVGTDNYVALDTNYIKEMLLLLYTDAEHLKITKLLMVTTGETRRPYISNLLWDMRKTLTK